MTNKAASGLMRQPPKIGPRMSSQNNQSGTQVDVDAELGAQHTAREDGHEDRRRHARANYRLKARYLGPDGAERPCVVINVSAGGAMVRAKITPNIGDQVILYIDSIGRFEGEVVRAGRFAFAVHYSSRRAKTQRTADALIRVLNRGQRKNDRRLTPRIDLDRSVMVTHEDGSRIECSILDISLTGASIKIEPTPALGTEMIVGRMKARVVRRHEMGVGVIFLGSTRFMDDVMEKAAGGTDDSPTPEKGKSGTMIASTFGRKT